MLKWRTFSRSRRDFLLATGLVGVGELAAHGRLPNEALRSAVGTVPSKRIPHTGEALKAIGLGTLLYGVGAPDVIKSKRLLLRRFLQLGGMVVDTAATYGGTEGLIGDFLQELPDRNVIFVSTKIAIPVDDRRLAKAVFERSFSRLRVDQIDLMQVHGWHRGGRILVPMLVAAKEAGRLRYIGVSDWSPELPQVMRDYPLDFIQVAYSLGDRREESVIRLAEQLRIGVVAHQPFGGIRTGNMFGQLRGRTLPRWALEMDIESWTQLFLKYVISHPAITCVIAGTRNLAHLDENMRAAEGPLVSERVREKMAQFWDKQVANHLANDQSG